MKYRLNRRRFEQGKIREAGYTVSDLDYYPEPMRTMLVESGIWTAVEDADVEDAESESKEGE